MPVCGSSRRSGRRCVDLGVPAVVVEKAELLAVAPAVIGAAPVALLDEVFAELGLNGFRPIDRGATLLPCHPATLPPCYPATRLGLNGFRPIDR